MQKYRRNGFTLVQILVVIAILAILIGLIFPAIQGVREASNRTTCQNNLRQMGMAMRNYADQFDVFPAPTFGAGNLKARSSLPPLLPYLGEKNVYLLWNPKYNWNDPQNANMLGSKIGIFLCPSVPADTLPYIDPNTPNQNCQFKHYRSDYGELNGLATGSDSKILGLIQTVTDARGLLAANNQGSTRPGDCLDGLAYTVSYAEDAGRPQLYEYGKPVPGQFRAGGGWASSDLNYIYGNEIKDGTDSVSATNDNEVYGFHHRGANMAFGDGSVRYFTSSVTTKILAAMITARGGEVYVMP